MKRSPMPGRRAPLRSTKGLAPGPGPERRTPINPQSKKRASIAPERRAFVAEILAARTRCEFPGYVGPDAKPPTCWGRSTDVHERWMRSALGPIVPSQGLTPDMVAALCRPCHSWVHDHPAIATALGFLDPHKENLP